MIAGDAANHIPYLHFKRVSTELKLLRVLRSPSRPLPRASAPGRLLSFARVVIQGKTITADALLSQRKLARYLVEERSAHYHFTAQGNQKKLFEETGLYFNDLNREPDRNILDSPEHGRIETRHILVTAALNGYLHFPHVGHAFVVERITTHNKTGKKSRDSAYGITSKTPDMASAAEVLQGNRRHWSIENNCHYLIDWNCDEDRSRIRKGTLKDQAVSERERESRGDPSLAHVIEKIVFLVVDLHPAIAKR